MSLDHLHSERATAIAHHDEAHTAGFPALARTIRRRITNLDTQIAAALAVEDAADEIAGELHADQATA